MGLFINEHLPVYINYGGNFKQTFAIKKQESQTGDEFRKQVHSKVRLDYSFTYDESQANITADIINFYHKTCGEFGVFRVRDWSDFSTNDFTGTPTSTDMRCVRFDPTTTGDTNRFKIVRWYDETFDAVNSARRDILLPVVSTVKLKQGGTTELSEGSDFSVNYSTGEITLAVAVADNSLTGGCEFDIPCRFNGAPSISFGYYDGLTAASVNIREVFNLPPEAP